MLHFRQSFYRNKAHLVRLFLARVRVAVVMFSDTCGAVFTVLSQKLRRRYFVTLGYS
jgi:hypothetical protein